MPAPVGLAQTRRVHPAYLIYRALPSGTVLPALPPDFIATWLYTHAGGTFTFTYRRLDASNRMRFIVAANGSATINEQIAGSGTARASCAAATFPNGTQVAVKCSAIRGAHRVSVNDVLVMSWDDTLGVLGQYTLTGFSDQPAGLVTHYGIQAALL